MTRLVTSTLLVAAAATLLVLSVGAPPAAAAKPCWRALIDDWYDGRIDGIYSFKCYREAKKRAPEDLTAYSDLPTDLDRALASMQRIKGPNGSMFLAPGAPGHNKAKAQVPKGSQKSSKDKSDDRTLQIGPSDPKGPIPKALRAAGPDKADQVPVPLLALGALALLLIAAGAAGFVTKRLRARRLTAEPPAPGS